MLPTLEGIIARRILLNFRADPASVRHQVPQPLELVLQNGFSAVGVCLIRLEQLRPKGFPSTLGMSSENMAHRVAIRYPNKRTMKDGVFIWRRDTDQKLMALLGGRLFPGVHHAAEFHVTDSPDGLTMDVHTQSNEADVFFEASYATGWDKTSLFQTFDEACQFFKRGDCGFSCSLHEGELEGMQLRTLKWEMAPLQVTKVKAKFYEKLRLDGPGNIEFDCGLIMRGIPHEWHQITKVPELAVTRTVGN